MNVDSTELSLQTIDGYLHLVLPVGRFVWEHVLGQLNLRLSAGVYQNCGLVLVANDQPIDGIQLQAIIATLANHQLKLHKVVTSNRSTAIVAAEQGFSVEQTPTLQPPSALVEPLYLVKILRSGVIIRHPGTIVLRGDVHRGAEIISGGDILVWGKLQGKAHTTNPQGIIMALELDPTQLQIGSKLAITESSPLIPEVAYLDGTEICIVPANEYKHIKTDR
jgi:septum site-determining protein MinC